MLNLLFKLLFERLGVLSFPIATSHLSLVCLSSAAKLDADEVGGSKLLSSSNVRPEANSQGKAAEVCVVCCNCVAYNFMLKSVNFAACSGLSILLFYYFVLLNILFHKRVQFWLLILQEIIQYTLCRKEIATLHCVLLKQGNFLFGTPLKCHPNRGAVCCFWDSSSAGEFEFQVCGF